VTVLGFTKSLQADLITSQVKAESWLGRPLIEHAAGLADAVIVTVVEAERDWVVLGLVLDDRPVVVVEGGLVVVIDVEDRLVVVFVVDGCLVVVVDVDNRLVVVVVDVRLAALTVVVVTGVLVEDACLLTRFAAAPRLFLLFSVTVAVSITIDVAVFVSTSNSVVVTVATTLEIVETVTVTASPVLVHGAPGTVMVA
jgi:hypothetical protein